MTQKWNLQDIRPAGQRTPPRPINKERQKDAATDSRRPATDNTQPFAARPEPEQASVSRRVESKQDYNDADNIVITDGRKKGGKRFMVAILLFVGIVGGAVFLSAVLGKTELTIFPQHREPNISAEFTAYPEQRENSLTYEILTLEATDERQVTASGEVQVEEQATGMITIEKSTPGAERLRAQTRFRTPDGLVFRVPESVVVPGAVDDKPGTIQAEVFADEVGPEYNVPAGTTFDVPGFEEGGFTELFKAITATANGDFSGGFSGPQFQIDEQELNTARQELQVALRNELLQKIENAQPADFVAFREAVAITYNQLDAVEYGDNLVTIREQAILQIPLFNATEFGSYLAEEAVATYEGGPVRVDDISALTFSYTSPTTSASVIADAPSLTFKLEGKPLLIWGYDQNKLTTDLAGLPKTALQNAITAYPGITGARVRITPFWKRTFPENPEDIVVIEELKPTDE